jgi:transposase
MAAILFMCRTSTPWALLPVREFGCGSVTTCWRRFAEWAAAGVFDRLQELLLDELGAAGLLDWSRVSVDSASLRAVRGDLVGANPVDRAKRGNKWHVAGEASGMVLSLLLGPANRPDQELFEAVLDDIPPVATPTGHRRCRPERCHADKAYDTRRCRGYLARRGIKVRIARCGVESSERLGRHRWKAERTIAWLFGCRRLRIRYDCGSERFYAFGLLACCRLSFNRYTDQMTLRPDRPVLAW